MSRPKKTPAADPGPVEIRVTWRGGGYYGIPNRVYDRFGVHLGATGFAVYSGLCRYANNETGEAWPKQADLAARLDLTEDVVGWYLSDIVELGLAVRSEVQRTDGKPGVRHVYELQTPPDDPPMPPEDAPRFRRSTKRQAKRAALSAVEQAVTKGKTEPFSVGQTEQVSLGQTEQVSMPAPNGLDCPPLTVRVYSDSDRESDSAENQTHSLPSPSAPATEDKGKGKRILSPTQARQAEIMAALIWVRYGWTFEDFVARKGEKALGQYRTYASQLDQLGATAEEIRVRYGEPWTDGLDADDPSGWWYRADLPETYPGRQGKRPTPTQVWKTWNLWQAAPVRSVALTVIPGGASRPAQPPRKSFKAEQADSDRQAVDALAAFLAAPAGATVVDGRAWEAVSNGD